MAPGKSKTTAEADENAAQSPIDTTEVPKARPVLLRHGTDPDDLAEVADVRNPGAIRHNSLVPVQDGEVVVSTETEDGELEGTLYPPKIDPSRALFERLDTEDEVFYRDFVLLPTGQDGSYGTTDCSAAVCTEAISHGYRPTGDARIDSVTDHPDGLHKVARWAVPVRSVKVVGEPDAATRRVEEADAAAAKARKQEKAKASD